MAAAPAAIVLLSLLLLSLNCHAENSPAILLQVVDAIEKLFGFYKTSYQHMNIDGIFGLKIVEGQIWALLEEHKQGQHAGLSPDIASRLRAVVKESQGGADRTFAAARNNDQHYFDQLAFLIAQPWTLIKKHRKIVPALRWEIPVYKSATNYMISEAESDRCMQELQPPNATQVDSERPLLCRLTEECGLTMTKRGLTEYSITHQVLWTALAEKVGCRSEMDILLRKLGFKSIDHMQQEFCTNIYYEMLAVVHVFMSGTVKTDYQDIFMEQQFICPSLGFYEFLKKKYLDQILSWQRSSGCFGDDSEDELSSEDEHLQDRPPGAAVNKLQMSEPLKAVPHVNSLDQQQQQLGEQPKDLESEKEVDRPVLHQPDSGTARLDRLHFDRLHQRGQKVGVNFRPETNDENRAIISKERNTVLKPQGSVPETAVRAGKVVNSLPGNHSHLFFPHSNVVDQRIQSPTSLGRKKESPNEIIELANADMIDSPRVKYSDTQNHLNELPVKWGDDSLHQIEIPGRREQSQQDLASKNGRGAAGGVRKQGSVAQAPDLNAGLSGERLHQPDYKQVNPYQGNQRRLLVEKEMPGHCLSHKTGVAAGALVMYLRYLIDPGPLDLFTPHDFFPDASRSLLGNEGLNKDIASFLGDQKESFTGGKDKRVKLQRGGLAPQIMDRNDAVDDGEEEEEEDEDGEDDEYDDNEELYPDAKEGQGPQLERKVVHFGANDLHHRQQDGDFLDNIEDEKDEYTDEEEEEGDYIKRVKGDDNKGADNPVDKDTVDDNTEYTYYDDDDDTDRGIIKRHKPQAPPQKGARIRTHNRHKPHPPSIDQVPMGLPDSPPTKTVVVLLSATSLLVIVFMYRFIRKRRVSVRHNSRGFFRL